MMDEKFHIKLEAKNPEKGNFRSYAIDAGPDAQTAEITVGGDAGGHRIIEF